MGARLKTSATCPACGGRLTVWAGLRSPSPLSMRCPECRRKLSIQWRALPFFVCAVVVGIIIGVFFLISGWIRLPGDTAIRFAVLLVGSLLLELVTAVVFFTFATFAPRS
jgi:hypothetical protein